MPSPAEMLEPFKVVLGFVLPLMFFLLLAQIVLGSFKRLRRASARRSKAPVPSSEWKVERAAEQIRAVEASGYERKPLLNREEARRLPLLERATREVGQGHRVMAQTSLGEVIRPIGRDDWEAHAAIDAKRLDFAIFDRWGVIVCAVEYQGTGHYREGAAFRDTVEREALRKAGVRVLAVFPDFTEAALARSLLDLLGREGAERS